MGNKQRMPIRAEGPHVGTDPVSVRTRDDKDGIRYAVGRPNWQRDGQTRGLSLLPPPAANNSLLHKHRRYVG